jgi:hypothetical protein
MQKRSAIVLLKTFFVGFVMLLGPVCAQCDQVALEANIFSGTLSYAGQRTPVWHLGLEVGCGIPQFDQTLYPDDEDFGYLLHLGPVLRFSPSEHVSGEFAVQLGLGDLHSCSGCLPDLYAATSLAIMVGWRNFKIGPQIVGGWINERRDRLYGFVYLAPVNFQVLYSW